MKDQPLALVALLAGLTIAWPLVGAEEWCCPQAPSAATTEAVPARTWQNDLGTETDWKDLRGHPVVVAFFFTNCHVVCPITVEKFFQLSRQLPVETHPGLRFVLITIDPAHDTVEVLHAFRKEKQFDSRFVLLRGSPGLLAEASKTLGLSFGKRDGRVVHSSDLVLLGPDGTILGRHRGLHSAPDEIQATLAGL